VKRASQVTFCTQERQAPWLDLKAEQAKAIANFLLTKKVPENEIKNE
jgi:hypothetical protein